MAAADPWDSQGLHQHQKAHDQSQGEEGAQEETVHDPGQNGGDWQATAHGVAKSWAQLNDCHVQLAAGMQGEWRILWTH